MIREAVLDIVIGSGAIALVAILSGTAVLVWREVFGTNTNKENGNG